MSASVAGASPVLGPTAVSSPPPPPAFSPNTNKPATLSATELRTGMQQHFRTNGTLQQLKTQLRGMMLTELLEQPKTARMLVGGAAQSLPLSSSGQGKLEDRVVAPQEPCTASASHAIAAVPRRTDHTLRTWSCGLADALVENHLRRTRRAMSLSIFSTEAEVPPFTTTGAPSEEEHYLAHLFRQSTDGVADKEEDFLTPSPARSVRSVLQRLVEDTVTKQGALTGPGGDGGAAARHLHSCSTQTNAADCEDGSGTNPLNSLECRLAAVDAKYALTFAQLKRSGVTGEQPFFLRSEVERRLAQYKTDIHAQLRSEYEQKYNAFTRVQLQEARDEAEQRYRVLARNKAEEFAEMERSVVVRLEQERERLKLSWEDVHQQRLEMERRQRDWAKQLADHEAAQQQTDVELHKLKETCRVLRLQCAKWEELCATRLMELDGARSREERRVEDIRRLQAEHASELRLKDEEVGRLRYRIRLLAREAEVPTTARGAGEETTERAAAHSSGTAPVDPKQLYGLLLRTEELQRNAVLQQQQQQQRWDAAWVAADPNVAKAPEATAAPHPSRSTNVAQPEVKASLLPSSAAPGERPWDIASFSTSVKASPSGHSEAKPRSTPTAIAPAFDVVASPSLSVMSEPNKPTHGTAVSATPASPLSSPPATAPIVAAQPATSRHSSSSTKTTTTARTSTSATSATTAATPVRKPVAKATPAAATSSSTSPASPSSKAASTSSSLSATPPPPQQPRNAKQRAITVDTAALESLTQAEGVARSAVVEDEDTARAGIAWAEKSKRAIVEETLKQAEDSVAENGSDELRLTRPWERPDVGSGTVAPSAAAVGGGALFDDSFTTDDDALIHSTDEDDSDF